MTLALGHKSIREAQRYIDSAEFNEWAAYFELEPFGPLREDQRFGVVAATIANVHKRKSTRPYKWDHFFPRSHRVRKQTWQQQLKIVEALNAAFGGKDLRKEKG